MLRFFKYVYSRAEKREQRATCELVLSLFIWRKFAVHVLMKKKKEKILVLAINAAECNKMK